jgi:hypothetical protein
MKFWLASLVWVLIGTIFGYSIYAFVVKSNPWIFVFALVGLIGSIGYFCYTDPSSNPPEHGHH